MSTDRNELKVMALRERVATLTADYEDKVADLRVELTIVSQEREEARAELEQMRAEVENAKTKKSKD